MEQDFYKLLNDFLTKEKDYITAFQDETTNMENFNFFMATLIFSLYQNDENKFIELWIFLVLNNNVDIQYLFFASNTKFIQKIKKHFDNYFSKLHCTL